MIVLGITLIILALLPIGLGVLLWPGVVILLIGAVLAAAGWYGHPVGGRRWWW